MATLIDSGHLFSFPTEAAAVAFDGCRRSGGGLGFCLKLHHGVEIVPQEVNVPHLPRRMEITEEPEQSEELDDEPSPGIG